MIGGESQGVAADVSSRHHEAEEGLYLPEGDRASLHDSEGSSTIYGAQRENKTRR